MNMFQVQKRIAAAIQQENVDANMEAAMEFSPESFGQVHMLYINCKVNGHSVKAFVDSGEFACWELKILTFPY